MSKFLRFGALIILTLATPVEPGRLRTGEKDNEVELSLRGGVPSGGIE